MNDTKEISKKETATPEVKRIPPKVVPLVDIYENDNEILLHVDMPGVEKDKITINMDNGKLHLSGLRKMETKGASNWVEFGDAEYNRSFSVPQTIDVDKVNAELKDGVLRLHLPKSEASKPRQIEIKAA